MIRGQDVVVLLKVHLTGGAAWTVRGLAEDIGYDVAGVSRSLGRLTNARLHDPERKRARLAQSEEFLIHAVKYVHAAHLGPRVRGIPTAWAVSPLADEMARDDAPPPVWPHRDGPLRGAAVKPVHQLAVTASEGDEHLRELLALVDATVALAALSRDDRFMWLLLALAQHSVIMVEVQPGDGRRRLVKLSYEERNLNRAENASNAELARSGLGPYTVFLDSPFIAAGTYHFELEAPPGLQVIHTRMAEFGYLDALKPVTARAPLKRGPLNEEMRSAMEMTRRGTRTHLYVPDATITDRAEVDVLLRVQREGFVASAAWAATAIFVVLLFFTAALCPVVEHEGPLPSALLLFPGVIATLIGRAGDHQLTIRMLTLSRWSLLACAACAYVMAVALSLIETGSGHSPTTLLWIVAITTTAISLFCAALLQAGRRLPKHHADMSRFDSLLAQALKPVVRVLAATSGRLRGS